LASKKKAGWPLTPLDSQVFNVAELTDQHIYHISKLSSHFKIKFTHAVVLGKPRTKRLKKFWREEKAAPTAPTAPTATTTLLGRWLKTAEVRDREMKPD
jgi:hypothetical protein